MNKKAIIIINLGSPEQLSIKSVGKFLLEFLNDSRVIDLPWIIRKILVNFIIVPFRVRKSKNMYKNIWSKDGSPIIKYSMDLAKKLNAKCDENEQAFIAMRYGKPGLKEVLNKVYKQNFSSITILPLFPQYASSTTGSVIETSMNITKKWLNIPEIKFVKSFFNHPAFIDAWLKNLQEYNVEDFDHILFSYHGLPLRHVHQSHLQGNCQNNNCRNELNQDNRFCYLAHCHEITRILTEKLNISEDKYTVCFQSRFSEKWLKPFADKVIEDLAKNGSTKIMVLPLSFVADCLETIFEIGIEYLELFKKHGGESLVMPTSLNDKDFWVDAIKEIVN